MLRLLSAASGSESGFGYLALRPRSPGDPSADFNSHGPCSGSNARSRVCTVSASLLGGLRNLVSGMAGALLSKINEQVNRRVERVAHPGLARPSAPAGYLAEDRYLAALHQLHYTVC